MSSAGAFCSGLTGSNYSIGYAGVGKGFVVNPILVTVNVSGSQTYGDASPILTYTTTPSGISIGGTLACTKVAGTPDAAINSTLAVGTYTVDPTTCSGLTQVGYSITYGGVTLGFTVSPEPVTVNVSGSQTYGDASPTFTDTTTPSGISFGGTLACTKVAGTPDAAINSTLAVGTYTVDPTTCSGLTGSNYSISYGAVSSGFVVNPEPVTVNVSGSQTYGDASPILTYTTTPSGISLGGTLACTKVVGNSTLSTISPTLAPGTYVVGGAFCSGLTGSNYSIGYAGVGKGFVVNPILVTVNVSGSQTYGDASPILTYTTTPSGISLGGPWACTKVAGTPDAAINSTLAVGTTPLTRRRVRD